MKKISKVLHLKGLKYKFNIFLVNKVYVGVKQKNFEKKRKLLNAIGFEIGEGTKIVGPIFCTGKLIVGENCWIGKNFFVNGNGTVTIGNNCDIAPEVIFQTGGHIIGNKERRAGNGEVYNQFVGDGCWIGHRSTIIKNTAIGDACVIGACSLVNKNIPSNVVVAGVPAKIIKELEN